MPNKLLKMLINNIGYKIAAVFFAVILWSYVLAIENPDTDKMIADVPLRFVNEDVLNRENLCVRGDKNDILQDIDVSVKVDRNSYRNVTAGTLLATVDLSGVKATGEYDLPIRVDKDSRLNTDKWGVNSSTPDMVHVEIDELTPNTAIPVQVNLTGNPPEGYYFGAPSAEPKVLQLSGPRKDVERVRQAVVTLDRTGLTRSYNDSMPVELRDDQGNVISGVSFGNIPSVIVKMDVLPTKTVPINRGSLLVGVEKIAPGYEININSLSPESVVIAAPEYVLSNIESVDVEPVDVQGLSESMLVKTAIKIPEGVTMTRPTEAEIYIAVNEITETVQFNDLPIAIEGKARNQNVTIEPQKVSISITAGVNAKINTISRGAVAPYIDVTGLAPGEHEVRIQAHIEETLPPNAIINFSLLAPIKVLIEEK